MGLHRVRKGLDLPIQGKPDSAVHEAPEALRVAILGQDFHGMKPKPLGAVGDEVKRGQPVFEDRKTEGVVHTAPAGGKVVAVHRGAKRVFLSLVIEVDGEEAHQAFSSHSAATQSPSRETVSALLQESGMWTAFRTRPYSRVPAIGTAPHSIFVTAMDTHPLAANPEDVLAGREDDFKAGLEAIGHLTDGTTYLCRAPSSKVGDGASGVQVEEFRGPHPAGTVGYHIHELDPVDRNKTVWHIGYEDVARIGALLQTGQLDTTTVVALAGPGAKKPRLLRTRLGADLDALLEDELETSSDASEESSARVISGSVLHGQQAQGEALGFLGRFHQQVSVLPEGKQREFLGWLSPTPRKYSVLPFFFSKLTKKFLQFNTSTNGSKRAMVPIGLYEKVMPFDLMPTHLLRALAVGDLEWAEELGVLELDEEDLGLCTYVCPSKADYGPMLRDVLTQIQKDG